MNQGLNFPACISPCKSGLLKFGFTRGNPALTLQLSMVQKLPKKLLAIVFHRHMAITNRVQMQKKENK